jgi:hypothetical protein
VIHIHPRTGRIFSRFQQFLEEPNRLVILPVCLGADTRQPGAAAAPNALRRGEGDTRVGIAAVANAGLLMAWHTVKKQPFGAAARKTPRGRVTSLLLHWLWTIGPPLAHMLRPSE